MQPGPVTLTVNLVQRPIVRSCLGGSILANGVMFTQEQTRRRRKLVRNQSTVIRPHAVEPGDNPNVKRSTLTHRPLRVDVQVSLLRRPGGFFESMRRRLETAARPWPFGAMFPNNPRQGAQRFVGFS